MKKIRNIALSVALLTIIVIASGYSISTSSCQENDVVVVLDNKQNQTQVVGVNMFVTHGHCSLPFMGNVDDLEINLIQREDQGNPLENMQISFDIDPNSFNVCAGDDLTARIKTPGLFIGENNEKITFRSTTVYTMGLDWYQVNGKMSIKGVSRDVKFFATGIRDQNDTMTNSLVLQSQVDLFDWGIDYDKIVTGQSDDVPTKLMFINMTLDMPC